MKKHTTHHGPRDYGAKVVFKGHSEVDKHPLTHGADHLSVGRALVLVVIVERQVQALQVCHQGKANMFTGIITVNTKEKISLAIIYIFFAILLNPIDPY